MISLPPCLLFEDQDLLVVSKPAGLNTHAPSPYAGEGVYDWLRHREPRWDSLAIIHRLDKETSGVLVFAKTPLANRALTQQFANRVVRKKYRLLTDRPVPSRELTVQSSIVRLGDRYVSRPAGSGQLAETRFRVLESPGSGRTLLEAEPVTGRTHQIRVHAADRGFPILGDTRYGGTPADRVCLHAAELTLLHPQNGSEMTFTATCDFQRDAGVALREALWAEESTNSYRLSHGASDSRPGWFVDRLGAYLLSTSENPEGPAGQRRELLEQWARRYSIRGVYHKELRRNPSAAASGSASPRHALGEAAPAEFEIMENGVRFLLSFEEGYSCGLFLDQRDNRRRLLTRHIAAGFPLFSPAVSNPAILNTFAYTCGFSVCAAKANCQTTSLDLSKRYLEWGQRNFTRNELDPKRHDFIFGDVFDWLHRLAKKRRTFDLVILDPPTFSRSKQGGTFQVEKDYSRLVSLALPLLKPNAVLLASTNAAGLPPEPFVDMVTGSIQAGARNVLQLHYVPQPPDFPISRAEPAYLKTIWCRVG